MTTDFEKTPLISHILRNPQDIIPELSNEDIRLLLIRGILDYIDHLLPITAIFEMIDAIREYCRQKLAPEVAYAVERIVHLEIPTERKNAIEAENVLVDTLDTLVRRINNAPVPVYA